MYWKRQKEKDETKKNYVKNHSNNNVTERSTSIFRSATNNVGAWSQWCYELVASWWSSQTDGPYNELKCISSEEE